MLRPWRAQGEEARRKKIEFSSVAARPRLNFARAATTEASAFSGSTGRGNYEVPLPVRLASLARMSTRIFLIRHGATVLTAEDRFAGATDVELSEEGREQARRLGERLRTENVSAVYASPLGRTVETATLIAQPHSA